MKKVIEFMKELPNPSKWAKEHGIPPWLVSRLRHENNLRISVKYVNPIIDAAGGQLSIEDFGTEADTHA